MGKRLCGWGKSASYEGIPTRVKLMKDVVSALINTLPNMSAILFLLLIISYIFGVLFTDLYKDIVDRDDIDEEISTYFSSLGDSFFTLFQLMTLDGWTDICREIMSFQPYAWIPFVAYVVVTCFMALNLIIAVICDAVSSQNDNDEGLDKSNSRVFHYERIDRIQMEVQSMKSEQAEIQNMLLSMAKNLSQKQAYLRAEVEKYASENGLRQKYSGDTDKGRKSFQCIK